MKLIIAPDEFVNVSKMFTGPSVFLGGGITGCKLWQDVLIKEIQELNCVVYNPRRALFDVSDASQSEVQIRWEFKYLNIADIVVFYFSSETMCPITLFELGARLEANIGKSRSKSQCVYVYCEPEYQRKFDVEFQMKLAAENVGISPSITDNVRYFHSYSELVYAIRQAIIKY